MATAQGAFSIEDWMPLSMEVLREVAQERSRQVERYGHNEDLTDFPTPHRHWLACTSTALHLLNADEIEAAFRAEYEEYEQREGKPTWMHLIREEVAEAFKETDPALLEAELIQVAALCCSWVETLRRRAGA